MKLSTNYVGLDVHKSSISVSLAEEGRDGEVRHYGVIENRPEILWGGRRGDGTIVAAT
jgi:hypothetical protein